MVAQSEYYEDESVAPAAYTQAQALPAAEASIVPADSIAGRALLAVIAIMTFLAALTLGSVVLVRSMAADWQSEVAREVTIQVRPVEGRDTEADVNRAVAIVSAAKGIAFARPYSREESAALLQPWLGKDLPLTELPIPRIIVVRITPSEVPDFAAIRQQLAAQVPLASLDDHRGFVDRMRAMGRSAVLVGLMVLGLVLAATMLSVMFATRGAMASNRPIIEVLHVVGARKDFIAGEFQRHFMLLGLKGGALGGGLAIAIFFLGGMIAGWAGAGEGATLFGQMSLGPEGYAAVVGLVVLVAAVTTGTSRLTVHHTLKSME